MKIGFDAKRAFLNATGLGNYARTLLSALFTLAPENRHVLYTPEAPGIPAARFLSDPARADIRLPQNFLLRAWGPLWRSFFIVNDMRRDKLDLYHGLSNELPWHVKRAGVRTVVTVHDLIFLRYPHFYPRVDRRIYEMKFRYACRTADAVVAVSRQTRQDIVEFFNIDPEKVTVIHQACHETFWQPHDAAALAAVRQQYGLPEKYILYVGAVSERKNLLALIQALRTLRQHEAYPLVVVGSGGRYRQKVLSAVAAFNMSNQVRFIDFVPNTELPHLYRQAALFVYPSFYEGFGIPILEALASRVPVITAEEACFREAGGPKTLYVNPRDPGMIAAAVREVMTSPGLRETMVREGEAHARRFDNRAAAEAVLNLYRGLVS
jgi:glycosyltransferase involved in cell wall biosynthesis